MEKRFVFTDVRLEQLPTPPAGKRACYYDLKCPGLELVITGKRCMSFFTKHRSPFFKQPPHCFIGHYPAMKLKDARQLNETNVKLIRQGTHPGQQAARVKEELTLQDVFEKLEAGIWANKRSPNTLDKYQRLWACHLTSIGQRQLSRISPQDVEKLHISLSRNGGKAVANDAIKLIRSIFNKAHQFGYEGPNPASRIEMYRLPSRDRVVEGNELKSFFEALHSETDVDARDFILMALFTGARKSNVLAMRWENISLDQGEWRIPLTKNQEWQRVALVTEALEVLRGREQNSEWVFPRRGPAHRDFGGDYWLDKKRPVLNRHIAFPTRAWKRILTAAKLENLRFHDLRRTVGSWQARTGASLQLVGRSLGHKSPQSTLIYSRIDVDPVRLSMQAAVSEMQRRAGVVTQPTKKRKAQ